jgi:hypothetical protein
MREIARTVPISPGNAGILQTLDRMKALVDDSAGTVYIGWGLRAIQLSASDSLILKIGKIYEWVGQHLTYTQDGQASDSVLHMEEELRSPEYLLHRISQYGIAEGDCDDFVILTTALLKGIGVTVRWVVTSAREDAEFDHVFLQAHTDAGWVNLDGIHGAPMGWMVPLQNVTNGQVVNV